MKINKIIILALVFALMLLVIVNAEKLSSTNYKSTNVVSSGGTNTSSSNYKQDVMAGTITGNITSSLYNMLLGFFYFIPKKAAGVTAAQGSDSGDNEWRMFGRFLNHTSYTNAYAPIIGAGNVTVGFLSGWLHSSPVIANGYVYMGDWGGDFYQFNASNVSQIIANYSVGEGNPSSAASPAVANGYVYEAGNDGLFQLNATNISQKINNYSMSGSGSSPAVAGSYVYVGSLDYNVYQFNASNVSQQIANFTTSHMVYSSPAVAGSYVYVGCDYGYVYQLNASNISQQVANYSTGGLITYSSPAVANGFVYIGNHDGHVYQLNASNISQKIANFTVSGAGKAGSSGWVDSSPAVANGFVYIGSYGAVVYQLNASNISQQIANFVQPPNNKSSGFYSSPAVTDKYVYVGSLDHNVYQLNASNVSRQISIYRTGQPIYSSPAIVNGYVYIGNDNWYLYQIGGYVGPQSALASPSDGSIISADNVTFNCSATSDSNLANISLYITDINNQNFALNQTTIVTGLSNSTTWTLYNLSQLGITANYTWNCLVYDNNANSNWAGNYTFSIPPYLNCNDTSGNWTIANNITITQNYTCNNIIVTNNSVLTFNSTGAGNASIVLTANNLNVTIGSKISADGTGYLSGQGPGYLSGKAASHGGQAGGNTKLPYGSSWQPTSLGSGTDSAGANGGGAVFLNVTNNLILDGKISAEGVNTVYGSSGGSVFIIAGNLTGGGNISAKGGNGTSGAEAGAGGRIAVYYNTTTWTTADFIKSNANPGLKSASLSKAGTLIFVDMNKNLAFITNGYRFQTNYTANGTDSFTDTRYDTGTAGFNFTNLTILNANNVISNATAFGINVSDTLTLTNSSLNNITYVNMSISTLIIINSSIDTLARATNAFVINSTIVTINNSNITSNLNLTSINLTVSLDSIISADGKGYVAANSSAPGWSSSKAASHGGQAGGNTKLPYGSSWQPNTLGSGTDSAGANGGGAVYLKAGGTLELDGRISAEGANVVYGSSGGSVFIIANNLTGTGNISAKGGNASSSGAEAGAGGRIAVYYNTTTWTTSDFLESNVNPGFRATTPSLSTAGTLIFVDMNKNLAFITNGYRFQLNYTKNGTDSFTDTRYDTGTSGFNFTNLTAANANNLVVNITSFELNVSGTLNFTNTNFTWDPANPIIKFTYGNFVGMNDTYKNNFNLSLERTNVGKIRWLINLSNVQNLTTSVNISSNSACVNSTAITGLNKSANITLYNTPTSFVSPAILRDGVVCNSSTSPKCFNFTSLNSGNATFNVSSWTTYKIGEGDTIFPLISITYPQNATYNYSITALNYTASDNVALSSCWYSLNLGVTNITITCGQNITGLNSGEGSSTWMVWTNDTTGNINSSSITFDVDFTSPNATILNPQNGTATNSNSQNFTLNVSDNQGLANATLKIYNQTGLYNQTTVQLNGATQTVIGIVVYLVDGIYNWFWNVVDLANNAFTTQTAVGNYTITTDTIPPGITITYPQNTTYSISVSALNYTIIETNPSKCWYSTNLGVTNSTPVNAGINFTNVISTEGSNSWIVYCNDTAGNLNFSQVTFFQASIFPQINFISPTPANNTQTTNTSAIINISISDANLSKVVFNWNGTNETEINLSPLNVYFTSSDLKNMIYTNGGSTTNFWGDNSLVLMMNLNNISAIGDSASTAVDVSKYSNNGTLMNGATWNCTSGEYGCYLQLDGINDYMSINLPDIGTSQTIAFWFNPANPSSDEVVFDNNNNFIIEWRNGNRLSQYTYSPQLDFVYTEPLSTGTWYHVALVRNETTALWYVNGRLSSNGTTYPRALSGAYTIGSRSGSYAWGGKLDELRVYNRTLSADEIQQQYYSNLKKYDINKWNFYSSNTSGTYLLHAEGGGFDFTKLNLTDYVFAVNKSNLTSGTYTYYGYASDTAGNANMTDVRSLNINELPDTTPPLIDFTSPTPENGTITVNTSAIINISITEQNLNSVIFNWNTINYTFYNDSLVMMYNFDNNSAIGDSASTAVDISKYGNNGTLTNGATWNCTDAKYGCALQLDGSNDYMSINLPNTGTSQTIAFWINPANPSSDEVVFDNNNNFIIEWRNGNRLSQYTYSPSSDFVYTEPLSTGTWYYVSLVRNETTAVWYVNGQLNNSGTTYPRALSGAYTIGSRSGSYAWGGKMDEFRVWNRSLSADEVKQQYYSNLNKYNQTQWYFYSNESNLTPAAYTYFGYAADLAGNSNMTETRILNIVTSTNKSNGESCSLSGECNSTHCTEGVCCNTGCGSLCESCLAAYTGGSNGTCASITTGTDPYDECTATGWSCSGSGAPNSCSRESGTGNCNGGGACGSTSENIAIGKVCLSGNAVDGSSTYYSSSGSANRCSLPSNPGAGLGSPQYDVFACDGNGGASGPSVGSGITACVSTECCYASGGTAACEPSGTDNLNFYNFGGGDDGTNDYCLTGVVLDCNVDADCLPGYYCASGNVCGKKPVVTLTGPENYARVPINTPVNFNFSVVYGYSGHVDNCDLWGNFGGTWALNQTLSGSFVYNNTITNFGSALSLPEGVYTWNVHCIGSDDWGDANFTLYSGNVPDTATPAITPSPAYFNNTLNCSITYTDPEADIGSVNLTWYKNDTIIYSNYVTSIANNSMASSILGTGNFTRGERIICSAMANDGTYNSNWRNSSTLTISDYAPIVTLTSPEDSNITTNRTPSFYWAGSDAENDSLTYDFNLTCYPGCSDDNRLISGISEQNYTVTPYLKYLSDNGFYYKWSARANDGTAYGNWSDARTISIQAELAISMPVNSVNFGSLNITDKVNTTTGNPAPLSLQNDGNCIINVTMAGTSLWDAVGMPSSYFQFKISNSTEPGSFSWEESKTSWTNVSSIAGMVIVKLNWNDSSDSANIDLLAEVPRDENPGNKSSVLTFVSSLGE